MFIITKGFSYLSSDSVSFEDESKNKRNIPGNFEGSSGWAEVMIWSMLWLLFLVIVLQISRTATD